MEPQQATKWKKTQEYFKKVDNDFYTKDETYSKEEVDDKINLVYEYFEGRIEELYTKLRIIDPKRNK